MTRIERIQNMTTEEMAEKIIELYFTDAYCKSDCERCKELDIEDGCCLPDEEKKCCIRWLNEEKEG